MSRALGGTHTCLPVPSWLVGQRELSQIPADHVELDLHIVEGLSVVDGHEVAHHVGHDNGVTEVSLDWHGLLPGHSVLLGLLALGVEPVVLVLDFWIGLCVLLANLLRCLALNSSTICSWLSS